MYLFIARGIVFQGPVGEAMGVEKFWWIVLSSICVVWSVQQSWRCSACYAALIRAHWPPTMSTLWQAWVWRASAERCAPLVWWGLSVCAVVSLLGGLFGDHSVQNSGWWMGWWCVIAVPALLIALARIDVQVFLLPDPLLLMWAALGALHSVGTGRWSVLLAGVAWGCFLAAVWGIRAGIERWAVKSPRGCFFQWLGAGDIKFLWAAFFWLPEDKVVLMWIYTAAFCWAYHSWQQRRFLPRGHTALGPHLILGWWVVKWVHPAVQYGYFLVI